jgi:hypothetical protein
MKDSSWTCGVYIQSNVQEQSLLAPGRCIGRSNVLDLFENPVEADDQAHAVHDQPNENEED